MSTVLAFYTTASQVLVALLLALSVLIAFAESAKTREQRERAEIFILGMVYIVALGLVFSLMVLASPDRAGRASFVAACLGVGAGTGAIVVGLTAPIMRPDTRAIRRMLPWLQAVLLLAAMVATSIVYDAPTIKG
jgi:DMSO reductase anchor subunit